ncbi:hypothetical protein BJ165DRAFT_1532706 [Panaeolus papilionaceus]|nr:hypothetical protein BJ165DRAFT_1532706 [Panaeolus papilionaceus]
MNNSTNGKQGQDCSKCGTEPSCALFPRRADGKVLLPPPQGKDGQNPKSPGTGQPNCRCEKCSASTNLGVSSSSHPHYRPNQTQSVYSQSNPIPNSTSHNGQPNSPELFIVQSTKNQTYMATASAHPLQVRMYCGGGK